LLTQATLTACTPHGRHVLHSYAFYECTYLTSADLTNVGSMGEYVAHILDFLLFLSACQHFRVTLSTPNKRLIVPCGVRQLTNARGFPYHIGHCLLHSAFLSTRCAPCANAMSIYCYVLIATARTMNTYRSRSHTIVLDRGVFGSCTSLTSADLTGVTNIGAYVATLLFSSFCGRVPFYTVVCVTE
jgi:hypothetical protein